MLYCFPCWDGQDDPVEVYLWNIEIRIVDLLTGEEVLRETRRSDPPPEELSILTLLRGATLTAEGEYHYNGFDYDRYAEAMAAYMAAHEVAP